MNLTIEELYGKWLNHPDATKERKEDSGLFLVLVNALIKTMNDDGFAFKVNPITGSVVGGETYGGFRPQSCPLGAPQSAHKEGIAVDMFDPDNAVDEWLLAHPLAINNIELYFEHPQATPHWSHWSMRKPKSGRKFFMP
jgi:hypothetical protein